MLIVDKRKGEAMPVHEVIPTPSVGLNRALNGGLNSGATHLFWGTPSVGKTTMCFRIIAEAQKMGYRPVIVDSESSYNDEYAKKCGINIDDVVIVQSTVVEDIMKNIIGYLSDDKEKHIFLFDSLSNIVKEEVYDKPESGKAMGLSARSQGYFLQKLVNYLHKERNIMLFVAHQTVDLSGMYAITKAKMGNTVHHNMSNIVKLFLSMSKGEMEREENNMITSQKATWTVEKTKQCPTIGSTGYYYVLPQLGQIDAKREMIDIAIEMDIIKRKGAWYTYKESKWNGLSSIELSAKEITELEKAIRAQVKRTEKEEIKRDKAKPVKNSGRGLKKGDASLNKFLVDYKHNEKSFTLNLINWKKMRKDAWNSNYKYPCISVVLGSDSESKVAIIDWEVFRELVKGTEYE